jgi:Cdc6-like AAA superfamily ATPase
MLFRAQRNSRFGRFPKLQSRDLATAPGRIACRHRSCLSSVWLPRCATREAVEGGESRRALDSVRRVSVYFLSW